MASLGDNFLISYLHLNFQYRPALIIALTHAKVLHNSYTMCTRGLPDIYTLSLCTLGVYIGQTTCAHGVTIKYCEMNFDNITYIDF